MRNVDGFDFSKFDVGGNGAKAGDNKLTGEEVSKARNAGWCVWDGMTKDEKPPRMEENFNGGYNDETTQVRKPPKKQIKEKPWKPEENFGPHTNIKEIWGFKPQPVQMPTVPDKSDDKSFNIPYDGNDPGFVMPKQDRIKTWDGVELPVTELPKMLLPKKFEQTILEPYGKQEKLISIDSELGKQINRLTMEYRESIDGKYEPVLSDSDPLGNRKILGYKTKNIWDVFK